MRFYRIAQGTFHLYEEALLKAVGKIITSGGLLKISSEAEIFPSTYPSVA